MLTKLPEEILKMIYDELYGKEIQQLQQVCRALYSSAHLDLLEYVELPTDSSIQKFINSIDYNPKQSYLNAVKTLIIGMDSTEILINYPYTRDNIHKLFLRFPNLQTVNINAHTGSFTDFKEEYCKLFLESCPKLNEFEMYMVDECGAAEYRGATYKLRHLLTYFSIDELENQETLDTPEEFFAKFPRLKMINGEFVPLSFKRLLPVLQQSPLNIISMLVAPVSEDNFVESYLRSKTTAQRSQLLDRFVNITELRLHFDQLCERSIRFVSSYLTGLKEFKMWRCRLRNWNDTDMQLFYNDILDIIVSTEEIGFAYIGMTTSTLTRYFSIIAKKLYQKTPLTVNRALTVDIDNSNAAQDSLALSLEHNQQSSSQNINIRLFNNVQTSLQIISELADSMDFDVFKVSLTPSSRRVQYKTELIIKAYENIFDGMGKLKKASIIVPEIYSEDTTNHFITDRIIRTSGVYPNMKELTISAAPNAVFQRMLNRFGHTCYNLECLTLYYYCGNWELERGQFSIRLPEYTLKTLTIDMTPLKKEANTYGTKKFFVIELETLNDSERQLLKASLDLTSVTRVIDTDLRGFVRGDDYFRLHIDVGSLERLDLCVGGGTYYIASDLKPVTCIPTCE